MKKQLVTIGLIVVTLILITFTSHAISRIEGSGNVVKKEFNVNTFTGISVGSVFNVYLKQGSEQSVILETDDNIIDVMNIDVSGNTLKVSMKKDVITESVTTMNLYITVENLQNVNISGASTLVFETDFNAGDKFNCKASGAAVIKNSKSIINADLIDVDLSGAVEIENLQINCNTVKVAASGAASATLSGSANKKITAANGAASVDVGKLKGKESDLKASQSGRITYNNTKNEEILNVSTSGLGLVEG